MPWHTFREKRRRHEIKVNGPTILATGTLPPHACNCTENVKLSQPGYKFRRQNVRTSPPFNQGALAVSTAAARVCQPGPLTRQRSRVSFGRQAQRSHDSCRLFTRAAAALRDLFAQVLQRMAGDVGLALVFVPGEQTQITFYLYANLFFGRDGKDTCLNGLAPKVRHLAALCPKAKGRGFLPWSLTGIVPLSYLGASETVEWNCTV